MAAYGISSYSDPIPDNVEIFDATGLIVARVLSTCTHLREPGQEYKETIASGAGSRSRRFHDYLRDAEH
jgi:dihydroorotase-like cyclic amidohydrolase